MPKRKVVEAPVLAAAEPKKARAAVKPKAPAAKHKRATKNSIEEPIVTPELVMGTTPLATVTAAKVLVTAEQISRLAYSYWEARGRQGGSQEQDWLRAERELFGNA